MVELNWRNICPKSGDGYSFTDFISLSYKCIFQNPDLFSTDDTIIELNHDFYFEEDTITQALQVVATIYFDLMTALDKVYLDKKIIPIGFYEGRSIEAFITFNDVSLVH